MKVKKLICVTIVSSWSWCHTSWQSMFTDPPSADRSQLSSQRAFRSYCQVSPIMLYIQPLLLCFYAKYTSFKHKWEEPCRVKHGSVPLTGGAMDTNIFYYIWCKIIPCFRYLWALIRFKLVLPEVILSFCLWFLYNLVNTANCHLWQIMFFSYDSWNLMEMITFASQS